MVVLEFGDEVNARLHSDAVLKGRDQDRSLKQLPGTDKLTYPAGYYEPTPDSDGLIRSFLYSASGIDDVEEYSFSPGTLRAKDPIYWIEAQTNLL